MNSLRMVFKNVSLEPFDSTANSVLVEDGLVVGLGDWSDIENLVTAEAITIDGEGCTLLPGIEDSHLHGYMYGRRLSGVDLSPSACPDLNSVNRVLREHAQNHDGWIRGYGWVSGTFQGSGPDGSPHQNDLIASGVDQPAILTDFSGHQAWCNAKAMELAGISAATEAPVGGVIVRDANGAPTGLLLEAAVQLVTRSMPAPTNLEINHALTAARDVLLANGITAFTEPGLGPGAASLDDGTASFAVLDEYRKMANDQELNIRVNAMLLFGGLGGTTPAEVSDGLDKFGPPQPANQAELVTVNQVKLFADGIPRSRTAWMSEPYDNCKRGHLTVAGENDLERVQTLNSIINRASARGWQLGIHATGDETISAIIAGLKPSQEISRSRHYVIHGDIIKTKDLPKFRELGIGLNLQPGIRWMVGRSVEPVLGRERALRRIELRRMVSEGIAVSLSSDAPVTNPDWRHIFATATRRNFADEPNFDDGQALTPLEAMLSLTLNPAFQSHSETWRGSISPGKVADLVLMDSRVDWQEARLLGINAKPRAVFLAGRQVFGDNV